nr:hypothetical protein [uncultured Streptococcus sp.]
MIKKTILFKILNHIILISVILASILSNTFDTIAFLSTNDINILEPILTIDTLFAVFITFFSFSNDKSNNIFGISPNEIIRTQSEVYQFLFTKSFAALLIVTNLLSIIHYFGVKNLIVSFNETYSGVQFSVGIMWLPLFVILVIYFVWLLIEGLKYIKKINYVIQNKALVNFYSQVKSSEKLKDYELKKYSKYIDLYESCRQETGRKLLTFLRVVDKKMGEGPRDAVRIMFESFDKADQIAALNICRNYVAREKVLNKEDVEKLLNEIDKKFEISR